MCAVQYWLRSLAFGLVLGVWEACPQVAGNYSSNSFPPDQLQIFFFSAFWLIWAFSIKQELLFAYYWVMRPKSTTMSASWRKGKLTAAVTERVFSLMDNAFQKPSTQTLRWRKQLVGASVIFWDKTELSAENSFEVTKETSHWFVTCSSRPELATNYI